MSGLSRQNDDMCRKCKPEEIAETPSGGSDDKDLAIRAKHPAGGHRLSPWRPILSPFVPPRSLPCLVLSLFGLHTAELLAPSVEGFGNFSLSLSLCFWVRCRWRNIESCGATGWLVEEERTFF
jgi:hypothetical protein